MPIVPGNGAIQQWAANQGSGHWLTQAHAARLDTVEDGVVPVSIEPSDLGIRVETQNVAVRDVYVLAFLWGTPGRS